MATKKRPQSARATCSVAQAAADAKVSAKTIRKWIKAGWLQATRPVDSGSSRYRISVASLRKLVG